MNIYVYTTTPVHFRTVDMIKILFNTSGVGTIVNAYDKHGCKFISRFLQNVATVMNILSADVVLFPTATYSMKIMKLAKIMKKRIISDFYISMYDTYVLDRQYYSPNSKKANYMLNIDKKILKKSDVVFFLNDAEASHYCDLVSVKKSSLNYAVLPVLRNNKRRAKLNYFRGEKDYLELCWTGSYIPLHGLDIILEAFRIVINRGIRCKLLIWGDDYNKAKPYIEYINKYGLENRCIVHNEWGNIKKWRDYMEEHCDVTLGIFGNSTKAKSVVANKVIDGIDFGTPVITGTSTGLDIYFDSSSLIIIDNSPEILADAIETIYNESFENIEKMTNKAYDIYKSYFSEDVFSLTLRNIINKIS